VARIVVDGERDALLLELGLTSITSFSDDALDRWPIERRELDDRVECGCGIPGRRFGAPLPCRRLRDPAA
jgi:hypothetical protein